MERKSNLGEKQSNLNRFIRCENNSGGGGGGAGFGGVGRSGSGVPRFRP